MSATEWAWIKAGSAKSAIGVVVMRIMPSCGDEEQGRLQKRRVVFCAQMR
jgi:hypothetical protein